MSWLKGVKDAANTSKYKGYASGGGVKPETVSADPTSTKVAGPKAAPFVKPMGGAAKPVFGKAGKKAFKTGGRVHGKKDGGPEWTGEGDSGKALKEDSAATSKKATGSAILSAIPIGIGGGLLAAARAPKTAAGLIAAGIPSAINMFRGDKRAAELSTAGDKAEGHKRGGKVSKKACGGSSGGERRLKAQENKEPL